MATMGEIEDVLQSAAPGLFEGVDVTTKETFGCLLDHYAASGRTVEEVLQVVDERLGATDLASAEPPEFEQAVEVLYAEVLQATPDDERHEAATADEIFAELGAAAAEDFAEELPTLAAATVLEVWNEVRPAILAEMEREPALWQGSDAESVAARREAAFYALCDALDGFLEAGESDGFEPAMANLD